MYIYTPIESEPAKTVHFYGLDDLPYLENTNNEKIVMTRKAWLVLAKEILDLNKTWNLPE